MVKKFILLSICVIFHAVSIFSQNYLRIIDVDWWAPPTTSTHWHTYTDQGQFDRLDIVVSPQGLFSQVEVYADISAGGFGPDNAEIVWQFDLPAQAVVHDSWLWVEDIIVKADVVDYWTALSIYEEIVDRRSDPSFLYIMPNGRYELRIFPLPAGESRRIKMSFLLPNQWSATEVKTEIAGFIFNASDYNIQASSVSVVQKEDWGTPTLHIGNSSSPITDIVQGGTGNLLHHHVMGGNELMAQPSVSVSWDAPYRGDDHVFLSTYEDGNDKFYQLAYLPDWDYEEEIAPERLFWILNYDSQKSTLSEAQVVDAILNQSASFMQAHDAFNVGVMTTQGMMTLSETWLTGNPTTYRTALLQLLQGQTHEQLLDLVAQTSQWNAAQNDQATRFILLAANDDYRYPPDADAAIDNAVESLHFNAPLTIIDYQNERVLWTEYAGGLFAGNAYFYYLLSTLFVDAEIINLRNTGQTLNNTLHDILSFWEEQSTDIVDFQVQLDQGITYHRFNLSEVEQTSPQTSVLLQTGKYFGEFPLTIDGYLLVNGEQLVTTGASIAPEHIIEGDTLMREFWYGHYLEQLMLEVENDHDRANIIALSKRERVLTPLTAFLALEPGLGGDPCFVCFNNDGSVLISTEDLPAITELTLSVNPNPVTDLANIRLEAPEPLDETQWTANVVDALGRQVATLGPPQASNNMLVWQWKPDATVPAGIYWCVVGSSEGRVTAKIIVQR